MMAVANGRTKRALRGLLVSFLCALACTQATYNGPRRGADEVALLITTGGMSETGHSTEIAKIDEKAVSGSKFELLPGRHSVEVKGTLRPPVDNGAAGGVVAALSPVAGLAMVAASAAASANNEQTSDQLVACFVARPKHTYEVRSYGQGKFWVTEVIDQSTTYDVKTPCESAKATR